MSSLNQAQIIGNLGKDPEVRYTSDGAAIATISVATSERWKDKNSGEQKERTTWHRVKFFGKLAEIAGEYLTKGSKVFVQGTMRVDEYEDRDGIKRYDHHIVAEKMQMLGDAPGKRDDDRGDQRGGRDEGRSRDGGNHPRRDGHGRSEGELAREGAQRGGDRAGNNYGSTRGEPRSRGGAPDPNSQYDDDDIPFN